MTPLVLSRSEIVSASMVSAVHALRLLLPAALAMAVSGGALTAQSTARVRTAENVRREPSGEVVARVEAGATMAVVGRRDRWLQVDVEGWMWERSLQAAAREGFDLTVSEPQGENLRASPSGDVVGRLGRGTLLNRVESRPGWIKVRRRAWIWSASVVETSTTAPTTVARAASPASQRPAPGEGAGPPGAFVPADARGAIILTAPAGDTVARTAPGAELEVVSREGSWARVRVEGWTWLPTRDTALQGASPAPAALTPADLTANPTGFRGRVVTWELQFISLERAERVRTDFFEGEPFLLTRHGGPDGSFVYVTVPTDRATEMEGLVPLERLRVTGRVRTGASSLTGTPIIDLVALERVRAPR
ncbi:MAG: hypothetical protein Q8N53_14100 [Longimicrobiales bacterium]|nr:hypothetical protein [Longimicrobiales bacterium]